MTTFRHLAPLMDLVPHRHAGAVATLLGRGDVLVDLGGGTGRVSRQFSDAFRRVVVADVERNMLRRAHARGLVVVVADARALPFKGGVADAVLCVDAFHHFPDQERVAREAAAILSPGGRLVLEEFDPGSVGGGIVRAFEAVLGFGSRFHRSHALRRLVEDATGLSTSVVRLSRWEYAAVATNDAHEPPHPETRRQAH